MSETWIVLGASSAMGRALARSLAERGAGLILAGRDEDDLAATAADCRARGAADAEIARLDIGDPAGFDDIRAMAGPGRVNCAVFVGDMPAQDEIDADPALIDRVMRVNLTGPAQFLTGLLPQLSEHGGTVVGVSSVAGDRGRQGNYVYGAAKAGFTTYLSGLRSRLEGTGAHVVTVKPGFVDTAMTWGLPGMFLVAPPERVARDILRAADRKRDVIYTPGFWRAIMLIIRSIPERVFKRLSI
ncbi:SDR family oxidoreductase [Palleronia sediminis]|uniref:SDR family oxidoreductase n=1 Tax=Palleronia sediminis TaxID=2547833 RepID=A0A4R6A2W9_9RHOB|nr:SDR family oxidoreductase [Palleronia sediminis]TDL76308.1 SDR family oxidoreductase [Palleronia sediminis]